MQKVIDWEAKKQREQRRLVKIQDAVVILESWLDDIFREGLANALMRPPDFWENMAKTMTDFQAKGFASMIRRLHLQGAQETDFIQLYEQLSMMYALLSAFKNFESFDVDFQADLLNLAGVNAKKEEVLAQNNTIEDNWRVLSVHHYQETEQLEGRKVWLAGQFSQRYALLLDFVYGSAKFAAEYQLGQWIEATLAFYPSIYPLRALEVKTKPFAYLDAETPVYKSLDEILAKYAIALAKLPWLSEFPCGVADASVQNKQLVDNQGVVIPLSPYFEQYWELMGFSDAKKIHIFGEWDGAYLMPHSAWNSQRIVSL